MQGEEVDEFRCDGCVTLAPGDALLACEGFNYCGLDCHATYCTAEGCREDPDEAWDRRFE